MVYGRDQAPGQIDIDIIDHRHRLAVWSAARAAQRGWRGARVYFIRRALEQCGISDTVRNPTNWPSVAERYDVIHRTWIASMQSYLKGNDVEPVFGRCAKVIAIYLKVTVIATGYHHAAFAQVIHPPIDDILLKTLAQDDRFPASLRSLWRRTRWTKLDAPGYAELITSFRACGLDKPAFWMIERYWEPGAN